MRVLLAQLSPASGDPDANAKRASAVLHDHADVELAVFPELFLPGYRLAPDEALAERCRAALGQVQDAAAETKTAVVLGTLDATESGYANVAALLDDEGASIARYRKTHLFAGERDNYLPGTRLVLEHLAGHVLGTLICFDMEFPEPARLLSRAGAELLVTIAANMEPYASDHALLSRARALENRLPHIYVNRVGEEDGFSFVGGSRLVAPDGSVVVQLAASDEEVAVAEVQFPRPDEAVEYLDLIPPELEVVGSRDASIRTGGAV